MAKKKTDLDRMRETKEFFGGGQSKGCAFLGFVLIGGFVCTPLLLAGTIVYYIL